MDTNVFISAFLFRHSTAKLAYYKARNLGKLFASSETYTELCDVLGRSKFDKYISVETRFSVLNELKEFLIFIDIKEQVFDCRDPKDNKFLELAVAANATCLVTGDNDLLVLNPFRNIPILNAADFVSSF